MESAVTFILKAEDGLDANDTIIFEVIDSEISTLPINWTQEDLDKHYKKLQREDVSVLKISSSPLNQDLNYKDGFIPNNKIRTGASTSLLDILIGLKISNNLNMNKFIVTSTSNFGHFTSTLIKRY